MLPAALQQAISMLTDPVPEKVLLRDAQALSARYREGGAEGARLVTSASEAAAYAASRMPATFEAVYTALSYTLACVPDRPRTLLDVGAGTGAAAFAARELLPLTEVVCLEREAAMRRAGQALMAGDAVLSGARWLSGTLSDSLLEEAGLVTAAYVLGELREDALIPAAKRLWEAAGKLLLLVEPGTPAGFARMRRVREALLAEGAGLVAPCPHEGECPVAGEDWCHFSCRVARSRLHRRLKGGDAPYEDEKFCYLALSRGERAPVPGRILRHPLTEPGRVTLTLCKKGGIRKEEVRKREAARFKAARKARWGDGWK